MLFRETFSAPPTTGQPAQGGEPLLFPTGWVRENKDGVRYGATSTTTALRALDVVAWMRLPVQWGNAPIDTVAISTSWTNPSNRTVDDWMISPAIQTGATATASWKAYALDPEYSDGYEVWVSTTTQTSAGCLAGTRIFQINAAPLDTLEQETPSAAFPQAALKQAATYLCFRNNNTDLYLLAVDDVTVTGPSPVSNEEEAARRGFDVRAFVQNGRLHARLDVQATEPVRVELYNALGQRVALLHDGPFAGGDLVLDALPAAGVYYLHASGARGAKTVSVLVTR